MSQTIDCPGCGASNPATATRCETCNYPFVDTFPKASAATPAKAPAAVPAASQEMATEPAPPPPAPKPEPRPEPEVRGFDPGPRPVRRARPRPNAMQPVQMQIVLAVAVAAVVGLIAFAVKGFNQTNSVPVAGANAQQQQQVDLARKMIEQDSTNVAARISLANALYDTANWDEAIVHYKSAMRFDPQRVTTIVDLGVCYYNLSAFAVAESLFKQAIAIDPKLPQALFNLGVVAEQQQRWDEALDYYHRSMQDGAPPEVRAEIEKHITSVMQRSGKKPPPLNN